VEPDALWRYDGAMGKIKTEYWLILGLVFLSALAFPAFIDVNRIQSVFLAVCAGIGIS
jgi:hypothetical protein